MTKITEQQINRVIELGKTVWENLSNEEQERYYYDDGTFAFVDNILTILHLNHLTITCQEFEELHDLMNLYDEEEKTV